jgi:hypothetical protein
MISAEVNKPKKQRKSIMGFFFLYFALNSNIIGLKQAPILFAKGCEIFITELTKRAW